MSDEPGDSTAAEGPRRQTFEPPSDDAVFTGSFPIIDDEADDPAPVLSPTYPEPPVRTSLAESVILARFRDGAAGSTADMIAELEKQVMLKEEEEETFASWAEVVRNLRGHESEPYIARQRIIFDGGDPGDEELEAVLEEPADVKDGDEVLDHEQLDLVESVPETSDPEGGAEVEADEVTDVVAHHDSPGSDDSSPADDHWPLAQEGVPDKDAPATAHASSLLATLVTGWGVGIPIAAILSGAYLSYRGLGIVESVVLIASLAVVVGIVVGVVSHHSFHRGFTTRDIMERTFGRGGSVVATGALALTQLGVLTFLVWWASSLSFDIIDGAGWTFDQPETLMMGLVALVVFLLVSAVSLTGSRVVQVALGVGSLSSVLALVALLVVGIPALEPSLEWTWRAPWMTVVSAGSLLLAMATLVTVSITADLLTLKPTGSSPAGGLVSALVVVLPFSAVALISAWMAQSSPLLSLGLLADPVGTLVEDAPAFYPVIALVALVLPIIGLAALGAHSWGRMTQALRIPGTSRVRSAGVLILVALALASLITFAIDVDDVVLDLGVTAGVIAVAVAAVLAKEWAWTGSHRSSDVPSVRIVSLVAVIVPVVAGWGLVESDVPWLAWQGFLFPILERAGLIDLSPASPGVLVSFVLAGIISGIGALVDIARSRKPADVTAE
jgi:hypothetical protein